MGRRRRRRSLFSAILLAASLTLASTLTTARTSQTEFNVQFLPSKVTLDNCSQQYPETVFRRLFSSQPRRAFALKDVCCTVTSDLVLLTGSSSSGKSALMKIIQASEQPVQGSCTISSSFLSDKDSTTLAAAAQAVYLDQRPTADSLRTVRQILQDEFRTLAIIAGSTSVGKLSSDSLSRAVCSKLSVTFGLDKESSPWMDRTTLQLSSSENYRLQLLVACVKSSLGNVKTDDMPTHTDDNDTQTCSVLLPAPVLLLDEWMDTEPTEIIQTVQDSLVKLTKEGAVVISATHKAERWKKPCSEIVLSSGKVLFDSRVAAAT